jgi:predicted secreted protein
MNWFTGVVLYVLIWWVALFAVLPFGVRTVPEADPSSGWRGTPNRPRLLRTAIATTLVAAVIWLSCRSGWRALPVD